MKQRHSYRSVLGGWRFARAASSAVLAEVEPLQPIVALSNETLRIYVFLQYREAAAAPWAKRGDCSPFARVGAAHRADRRHFFEGKMSSKSSKIAKIFLVGAPAPTPPGPSPGRAQIPFT